jgi:hypothetical protein
MSNKIVLLSVTLGSALLLGGCALSAGSLYPSTQSGQSSTTLTVSPTPNSSPVPSPSLSTDSSSSSIDKDLNAGAGADNLNFTDISSQ